MSFVVNTRAANIMTAPQRRFSKISLTYVLIGIAFTCSANAQPTTSPEAASTPSATLAAAVGGDAPSAAPTPTDAVSAQYHPDDGHWSFYQETTTSSPTPSSTAPTDIVPTELPISAEYNPGGPPGFKEPEDKYDPPTPSPTGPLDNAPTELPISAEDADHVYQPGQGQQGYLMPERPSPSSVQHSSTIVHRVSAAPTTTHSVQAPAATHASQVSHAPQASHSSQALSTTHAAQAHARRTFPDTDSRPTGERLAQVIFIAICSLCAFIAVSPFIYCLCWARHSGDDVEAAPAVATPEEQESLAQSLSAHYFVVDDQPSPSASMSQKY